MSLFAVAVWGGFPQLRGIYRLEDRRLAPRMWKVRTEERGGDGAEIKNMFHNRLGKGSTEESNEEKGRHREKKRLGLVLRSEPGGSRVRHLWSVSQGSAAPVGVLTSLWQPHYLPWRSLTLRGPPFLKKIPDSDLHPFICHLSDYPSDSFPHFFPSVVLSWLLLF